MRRWPRELTEPERLEIGERYADGAALGQLAHYFKAPVHIIEEVLDEQGIAQTTRSRRSRGRTPGLTAQERATVAHQFTRGASITELARDYLTTPSVIADALREHRPLDRQSPTRAEFDHQRAVAILSGYRNGGTERELAWMFNLAFEQVARILDRAGVPRRERSATPGWQHAADDAVTIVARYGSGESVDEIAIAYDTSWAQIEGIIERGMHQPEP